MKPPVEILNFRAVLVRSCRGGEPNAAQRDLRQDQLLLVVTRDVTVCMCAAGTKFWQKSRADFISTQKLA